MTYIHTYIHLTQSMVTGLYNPKLATLLSTTDPIQFLAGFGGKKALK